MSLADPHTEERASTVNDTVQTRHQSPPCFHLFSQSKCEELPLSQLHLTSGY